MLRKVTLTILFATAVAISLIVSAGATDNPKFLMATGKETIVGMQPGEIRCAGGQPTGQPFPFVCSPETKQILVRGEVESTRTTDVTGTAAAMFQQATTKVLVNCNLDPNLEGECWGTFEITVPGQGKWEGSWNGTFDLKSWVAFISGVGHGSGERLDGLQMKYESVSDGTTPYSIFTARVNTK